MTSSASTPHLRITSFPPAAALALGLACVVPGPAAAQLPDDPRSRLLVDAAWVAEHLHDSDLVLLQVGPEEAYEAEHIPGARSVDLGAVSVRRPLGDGTGTEIPLELPPAESLRGALEALGVSDDSRVVVYFADGWVTPSARVVFTLDWAGLGDRTSLLDGGLDAWKAAGGAVTSEAPPAHRGRLTLDPPDPSLVVDWTFVRDRASTAPYALVDARSGANYDGVREDHGKEGHIPGAGSLPWPDLIDEGLKLRPAGELRELFRRAGVRQGDEVVAYCHIGQFATLVLFAARTLGHRVHLFDGSMHEWAARDLPVTTEPTVGGGR